ncbi:hypothetical protein OSTOST_01717 [Ostertagia ostertagi]
MEPRQLGQTKKQDLQYPSSTAASVDQVKHSTATTTKKNFLVTASQSKETTNNMTVKHAVLATGYMLSAIVRKSNGLQVLGGLNTVPYINLINTIDELQKI